MCNQFDDTIDIRREKWKVLLLSWLYRVASLLVDSIETLTVQPLLIGDFHSIAKSQPATLSNANGSFAH